MSRIKNFLPFLLLLFLAIFLSFTSRAFPFVESIFSHVPEGIYLIVAIIFAVGYGLNSFAPKTAIPSFVWAIFFGMALQPVFALATGEISTLHIIVELLAAIVLFGGGVEIPFQSFKKHFGPIAVLSVGGTLLTAFLLAFSLEKLGFLFGLAIPASAFVLMGAILASIDPTAIIPSLKSLHFKKPFLRDFAVSESAVNDVVGTILTRFFLVAALSAGGGTVLSLFAPIFKRDTLDTFALEIIWGVLVGIFGAWVLKKWYTKRSDEHKNGSGKFSDPALFFAVPIFTFALGSLVGGSGFLAAFVAGLLYQSQGEAKAVVHFFEMFNDGFIKPIIFVLLGAVVPLAALLDTAHIGIIAALLFMFAIRPFVVFLSLSPWIFRSTGSRITFQETLFISFIRETGAIPAVLILVAVAQGVPGSEYIFSIGMWVILLTLILEPPLTPWVARKLGVAK